MRLKYAESYAAELIAAVAERTTDIAFVRNIVHRPPTLEYRKLGAEDVYLVLDVDHAVAARDHFGGTAPNQVRAACGRARRRVAD